MQAQKTVSVGVDFNPFYEELRLVLLDYEGKPIVVRQTSGVDGVELKPGDYLVNVSGVNGATNDYALAIIADIHGDTHETATLIRIGDSIESFLDTSDDIDRFRFEARKDDVIGVSVEAQYLGSSLDPILTLFDHKGRPLVTVDDVEWSHDPRIDRFLIPTTQTYWIEVRSIWISERDAYTLGEGIDYTYTLTLFEGGLSPDDHDGDIRRTLTRLTVGEPVEGVINFRSDIDGFQFEATDGQRLTFELNATFHNRSVAMVLTLYDESREVIAESSGNREQLDSSLTKIKMPADGTYFVTIRVNAPAGVRDLGYTLTVREAEEELEVEVHPDSDINDKPPSTANPVPVSAMLRQNFPNPFNPETWIPYQLSKDSAVTIAIYDVQGMIIRELNLGFQRAGTYLAREKAAYWDGRNRYGRKVANGVYFYHIQAGEFFATRRMAVVK